MTLKNKILGGLYGQALGDAWAMPAYFDPQQTWEKYGGWIESFLDAPDDHEVHKGLTAANITDDSEQAFSLAQEYIKAGSVTTDATIAALMAWYDRVDGDNSAYVGPSTRAAITALKKGADPVTAGRRGDTNGAAMRVSVVGLLNYNDPLGAIKDAEISCVPTHGTNAAISGASAVASAIAIAMRDDATIDSVVAAGVLGAELGRSKGTKWLHASVTRRIEQAVAIARKGGDPYARLIEIYDYVGTSLAIGETVGAAFGIFVMANGDPVQTAIYGAALSGDADTVAAIACAIAGAYKGIEGIDPKYIKQLDEHPVFASYNVHAIADGIEKLVLKK